MPGFCDITRETKKTPVRTVPTFNATQNKMEGGGIRKIQPPVLRHTQMDSTLGSGWAIPKLVEAILWLMCEQPNRSHGPPPWDTGS